jgi:predicted RecA/RadA family phage recombinase
MATNYVQPGDVLTLVAPYNRTSGQFALVGTGLFGVALTTVTSGASAAFAMEGVFTLAKVEAQEWATIGLPIYWDNSAKLLTTTSGGNTLVGYNTAVAANPSTTGTIRIVG